MSELFNLIGNNPGLSSQPTPFTPQMEQQYQQWRADRLKNWQKLYSKLDGGGVQPPEDGQRKHDFVLKYYATDSPKLRQEFQSFMAGQQK